MFVLTCRISRISSADVLCIILSGMVTIMNPRSSSKEYKSYYDVINRCK